MDIYRAERLAQDMAVHGGDWDKSFVLLGPRGAIECEWLDPYFGLFQIKGQEGFVMTKQIPAHLDIIMPAPESTDAVGTSGERS
jgi:hypothetical protein